LFAFELKISISGTLASTPLFVLIYHATFYWPQEFFTFHFQSAGEGFSSVCLGFSYIILFMTCLIGSFKVHRRGRQTVVKSLQIGHSSRAVGIYARTWLNCSQVAHSICQNEQNFTM